MPAPPLDVTHPTTVNERTLSTDECRSWLENHRRGRLGYLSGRGPRSVAVSYAIHADSVLLRVGDYNDIAQYAPGAPVRLEVEGLASRSDGEAEFDTVTVGGRAARVQPAGADDFDDFGCEVWPDGVATTLICVPILSLGGSAARVSRNRDPNQLQQAPSSTGVRP